VTTDQKVGDSSSLGRTILSRCNRKGCEVTLTSQPFLIPVVFHPNFIQSPLRQAIRGDVWGCLLAHARTNPAFLAPTRSLGTGWLERRFRLSERDAGR
jgi:hypothetical protein